MDWDDVLDPELDPEEVLLERVPALHRDRREQFRQFVKTSLIFSIEFADTDERFTLLFDADDAEARCGDMIDFPQASIRGARAKWRRSIELASRLVVPADEQIERYQGHVELTKQIRDGFERFDGVLKVAIVELPDGGEPLDFEIILNDYTEPPRATRAELTVQWSTLVDLAHGRLSPVEAARAITVRGAMGLAFDIGGYFMHELDL